MVKNWLQILHTHLLFDTCLRSYKSVHTNRRCIPMLYLQASIKSFTLLILHALLCKACKISNVSIYLICSWIEDPSKPLLCKTWMCLLASYWYLVSKSKAHLRFVCKICKACKHVKVKLTNRRFVCKHVKIVCIKAQAKYKPSLLLVLFFKNAICWTKCFYPGQGGQVVK